MKILRLEIGVIYESIKAENEVFLESILKKIENNTSGNLKDIYQSAKEKNTVTVRVKGRVRARDVRDTEGDFNTQTLHANNEAENDEIRDRGNDGVGGDGVGGDGVGGDRNEVVVGAENCIRKFNKGAENCISKKIVYETTEKHHIFVLDKGEAVR